MLESQKSEESEKNQGKKIGRLLLSSLCALILLFSAFTIIRLVQFKKISVAEPLAQSEDTQLQTIMTEKYPERYGILKSLPYTISKPNLDVWAKSSILIDISNGDILYENNADQVIPPASMTKLFALYVVEEEIAAGHLSYDQIIPLPAQCWACNMPPHSSLMFLGEGQVVTLEELLTGLSVCSGNDAAYALAYVVCGNMEDFVQRMNNIASGLGLTHTHFVESSGYSSENSTTAREMAAFCRVYLQKYPDSLGRYHSVKSFTYPKEKNLAPGDRLENQDFTKGLPRHITMPVTQQNTNPLLGRLDGVDGLKTGYIDESGYNLSLTALRNGTRYLSVTMEGPGANAAEGQAGRVHDGTELMNWAFSNFADFSAAEYNHTYFMKCFGASEKAVNLIPVIADEKLTVPYITGSTMEENLQQIQIDVNIYDDKWGEMEAGRQCGVIKISLNDYVLDQIPLVADRSLKKSDFITSLADRIIMKIVQ